MLLTLRTTTFEPYQLQVAYFISIHVVNVVLKVSIWFGVSGMVSTLSGSKTKISGCVDGVASAALFYSPFGLSVGSTGNLVVADSGNNNIRQMTFSGEISLFTELFVMTMLFSLSSSGSCAAGFQYVGSSCIASPAGGYSE